MSGTWLHPKLMQTANVHRPHGTMNLRLLRLFLGFSAFAWGISVVGVFLSWPAAAQALQGLGAQPIAYDPMLDYWLRMAAGAFALVGGLFLLLMLQPVKYRAPELVAYDPDGPKVVAMIWLGTKRGYLTDWITQRWVQFMGRKVDLASNPWLAGPSAPTTGIGADYFASLARLVG
jgi:hypothetical protein